MRHPSRRPSRLRVEALEARDVPVNLLVTSSTGMFGAPRTLVEYNPNNGIVASRAIPAFAGQAYARDVDVTAGGKIVVYNGTEPSAVSIFHGTGWTHVTMPGMSAYPEPHVGGLATAGRYVFAPDMTTAGAGQASGIVRIDLTTMRPTRFLDGFDYSDLTVGLDGYLYGTRGELGPIDRIDPATMEREATILPGGMGNVIMGVRGVAVNANGELFVISRDRTVHKLSPDGNRLAEYTLPDDPAGGFYGERFDIDIANGGGQLVIGGQNGYFFLLSTAFTPSSFQALKSGSGTTQVTFKEPPPPLVIPDIRVNNVQVDEGDTGTKQMTFTVSLSEAPNREVTVDYTTRNGAVDPATEAADYVATAGTITFLPNQTSRQVTVDVIGDIADEDDETVELFLTDSTRGVIVDDLGVGTILNDEITPFISIADVEAVEGDTAAALVYTVTLSEPANRPVSVQYRTLAGSATADADYTTTTGTLTFAAGETSLPISVPLLGDTADEPDETVYLALSAPVHGVIVGAGTAEGRILDDDGTPVVNIVNSPTVNEGNTGTTPVTFTVKLSKVPKIPVTVAYNTLDGTALAGQDYEAKSGTVTFPVGTNTQTVPVNVLTNKVAEELDDETFDLVLTEVITGGAELGDAQATATITDDDIPPVAQAGPPTRVINEGAFVQFRATGSKGVAPLTYTWEFSDQTVAVTRKGFAPKYQFLDSSPLDTNGQPIPFEVKLTVLDGNGSVATDTVLVTSRNLNPRGAITGPGVSVPGWARPLTFTGFDASPDDKAALRYEINWGDGQTETIVGGPKLVTGHAYNTAADYLVRMTVHDDDTGLSRVYSRLHRVKPTLLELGTLYVPGTAGPDAITVRSLNDAGTKVEVVVGNAVPVTGAPGTVVVFGREGDDTINVVGPVKTRLILQGGAGNDSLNAATAVGPVVLTGGAGDDTVTGGSGRDLLIGGTGADQLDGGADDDVALGEGLTFEGDVVGLRKLSLEWARATLAATYDNRRDRVTGDLRFGLNKPYYLDDATLTADDAIDSLTGGAGRDWFIDVTHTPNVLQDRVAPDETVTTI